MNKTPLLPVTAKTPEDGLCAYCRQRPATTRDHVIPKTLRRRRSRTKRYESETPPARRSARIYSTSGALIPRSLRVTVASCQPCNLHKATRRLIPASWTDRLEVLSELFPGTPWRVWHGGLDEEAYTAVHV